MLSAFMFNHSVDFSCLLTLTSNLLSLVSVVLMCLLKFGINIAKHIIFLSDLRTEADDAFYTEA